MNPTSEQINALALAGTGQSVVIEAGAGAGKTSTLRLIAEQLAPRRGQYVAFNKAIVVEAGEKMPSTVAANTAHSLAFKAVGKNYGDRLRHSKRMLSREIANKLGIDPLRVTDFAGESKLLTSGFLAGVTMRAVTRFCQSADAEPTHKHVPYTEGLDAPGEGFGDVNRYVARYLESFVKTAWLDFTRTDGVLPYKHDHYLKQWQLTGPVINSDFILFDEAQDANPVMVAIVAAQTHAQLVWVGDSQQQIYAFTGAVNALAQVPAENRAFLTQSFRFGQPIADEANRWLARLDAELRLRGTDTVESRVGDVEEPNVVLTRTNSTAVREVLAAQRDGRSVHLVGGGTEIVSFAKAAGRLMGGYRVEHPELACFESWTEVLEYVQQDEQGAELRLQTQLVNEFGVQQILSALDRNTPEKTAELVVSTAHKSKGREWSAVRLAGDFANKLNKKNPETGEPVEPQKDELRLMYVAVTRARHALDISSLAAAEEVKV